MTSVLLGLVLTVYWWRSCHGHVDSFTLGSAGSTQSHFSSTNGRIVLEVTNHLGATVISRLEFYSFKNVLGYFLIVPAFWLALKVRSLLPRPPGRGNAEMKMQNAERKRPRRINR